MVNNELFSTSGFLPFLQADLREQLLILGKKQIVSKEQNVFQAGAGSGHAYIIIDGRVKIFQVSSLGKAVILWLCFPGDMFGLAELVRGGCRKVHAQACRNTTVVAIPYKDLKAFLKRNPTAALLMIDFLTSRLHLLGESMLNMAAEDAPSRVVKLLRRLCICYAEKINGMTRLAVQLTHQEMADMIGTSRQTVTTALSDLRRKGVISVKNHYIYILRPELLEEGSEQMGTRQNNAVSLGRIVAF
jgi:CRP/FNR family cyclic AMP-dependent transcriptional regulator